MPAIPEHDTALMPRLALLLRVESMINIGCHYGPNDLEPSTWDHLLVLASERQFLDRLTDRRREVRGKEDAALSKARAAGGVPAPGGTLFPTKHPFKKRA